MYTKLVGPVLRVQPPFSTPNHRLIIISAAPQVIRTLQKAGVSSILCRPNALNISFGKPSHRGWFLGILSLTETQISVDSL